MAKLKTTTSLTLIERILIPGILKKEGDFKSLIINKDIQSKVSVTQGELKKFEIKVLENGSIQWNEKGTKSTVEIALTDMEKLEIKLALQKLDEDKKLGYEHISLFEKFAK